MRTTVSIDDDVLAAARERAAREGRTIGEVLSALARLGLTARAAQRSEAEFHGFRPLPARGRPVTNAVIDGLREDEAE
jgi:hypothetical protein